MSESVSSSEGLASRASGAVQDSAGLNLIGKTLQNMEQIQTQGETLRTAALQDQGVGTRIDVKA